jgi:mRNA export factor
MAVTGSWDKTCKYWDLRQPTPAFTLTLPERCYSLDVKGHLMVVATAEKQVQIFNLNTPSVLYKVSRFNSEYCQPSQIPNQNYFLL